MGAVFVFLGLSAGHFTVSTLLLDNKYPIPFNQAAFDSMLIFFVLNPIHSTVELSDYVLEARYRGSVYRTSMCDSKSLSPRHALLIEGFRRFGNGERKMCGTSHRREQRDAIKLVPVHDLAEVMMPHKPGWGSRSRRTCYMAKSSLTFNEFPVDKR